jgi:hypothetical protein
VLGAWLAAVSGVADFLDAASCARISRPSTATTSSAISASTRTAAATYACGDESGLLLCTWPRGGAPTLPFVYSNEVWTGIEYQVASHLMLLGRVAEGLEIVRACRPATTAVSGDPFDEYECGHWYARARWPPTRSSKA